MLHLVVILVMNRWMYRCENCGIDGVAKYEKKSCLVLMFGIEMSGVK